MPQDVPYQGVIGRTLDESTPWWPPLPSTPDGAPNVVIVLLDDVGYAQFGCYGSDIATPTFDRLAREGLRYSNFHTTALCSPTRACLLTGRNHHTNGMGRIVEFAQGFPGYDATIPRSNGMLSEVLRGAGYATFAVGKWHLTPAPEMTTGASKARWPLGRGFDRFYGFMAGETDQYHPDLVHDNHQVDPPRTPEEGYHLTEDLADHAIAFIDDLRAAAPGKPFFLYFAPGACHAPHQAPRAYIDKYRGQFDTGWDRWREEVFARQVESGLLPARTRLSERPHWIPAWDSCTPDEQRLYARMMEVYAGFLEHTDAQVARIIRHIEMLGELDNTVVLVMSDNGASAEGGPRGSFNEMYFFNFEPESLEENLRRIDELGGPNAHNHYAWGWAWAGNCPFKRWKRETHEGGIADPLIVHWPARFGRPGATRHQYVHCTDVTPTLLDAIGIEPPDEIDGVPQTPLEGVSFAPTFDAPDVPSAHTTQYYEMLGSRALYHDGWKAVVFHPFPGAAYDGSDPRKPFDEDDWELYHVAEDFSETNDLAASMPEKLAEMVERWWAEAERHNVLPLNNQPGRGLDRRHRRERYVLRPGVGAMPEAVAPNLRNRAWSITAVLDVPPTGADGVLVAHGSAAGGYAFYLRDNRAHFGYNFLGAQITTVTATSDLPTGAVNLRAVFTPTGAHQGDLALFHDDEQVGAGHIPRTVPITYGVAPFSVGYQRSSAIVPDLVGKSEITPGVVREIIVETEGRPHRDPRAEQRAALGTQ